MIGYNNLQHCDNAIVAMKGCNNAIVYSGSLVRKSIFTTNSGISLSGMKNALQKNMDKIGITIWNDLVSPLFDASCTLKVINDSGGGQLLDIKKKSLQEKADICMESGIQTLICGAISNSAHGLLVDNGISVIGWIQGAVDDILEAYSAGEVLTSRFGMPGCNQYHRHHCRRAGTGRKGHVHKGNGRRGCGGSKK